MTFTASPKDWQIWVILEQQREAHFRVLLLEKSLQLTPLSAPRNWSWASRCPRTRSKGISHSCRLWGTDAATGLHHLPGRPWYLPAILNWYHLLSIFLSQKVPVAVSDMPGLSSFCIWGCVQLLLTWQYVKYHLAQVRYSLLIATQFFLVI